MVECAKVRFDHIGFQISTGTRYLGGFIRHKTDETSHIRAKVGEWTFRITRLASIAQSLTQATYIVF